MCLFRKLDKTSVRLRLTLAVMACLGGALVCFYPSSWHQQITFFYINRLGITWYVYGAVLLVAGICIVFARSRPFGYLLGAVLYSFFSLGTWLAVIGGLHWHVLEMGFPANHVGNPFAAVNLTSLAIVYWVVARDSIYKQVDPELGKIISGSTTG